MTPTIAQVLEGEAAEKVFRRRTTCLVCGDPVRQPKNGRPRILCRKRACDRARHNQLRKTYRAPVWTEADFEEAARLWQRCASCYGLKLFAGNDVLYPHVLSRILPVCAGCVREVLPDRARARAWLARVRPGCPLPDPFAGGGK